MAEEKETVVKRDYKSRMFTMIFSDKKELLELYNAVSGKNYEDPELLTINTLENAIYMSMKNDLSFVIESRLSMYEHQSTYNPNLPLRFLMYLSNLYAGIVKGKNLYGTKLVKIPTPKFIVFYNGVTERPDREELKLSDAYMVEKEEVSLELKVEMLNINAGRNQKLKKACKTLNDYSEYVHRVREYAKNTPIEDAVEKAITECIQEGILKEFLEQNRAEAKAMTIFEYNEEEHMRMEREDAFEDGREAERVNTEREKKRADEEKKRADEEKKRADEEKKRADEEKKRADVAIDELERLREEVAKIKSAKE